MSTLTLLPYLRRCGSSSSDDRDSNSSLASNGGKPSLDDATDSRTKGNTHVSFESYKLEGPLKVAVIQLQRLGNLNVERIRAAWQATLRNHSKIRVLATRQPKIENAKTTEWEKSPLQFGLPPGTKEHGDNLVVRLYLAGSEQNPSLHLCVHMSLLGDSVLSSLVEDFLDFYSEHWTTEVFGAEIAEKPIAKSKERTDSKIESTKVYWRRKLDSLPDSPLYTFDFSDSTDRIVTTTYMENDLASQARKFVQELGVSLHTAACGAWAATLRKHTNCGHGYVTFVTLDRINKPMENSKSQEQILDSMFPISINIEGDQRIDDWVMSIFAECTEAAEKAFIGLSAIRSQTSEFPIQTSLTVIEDEDDSYGFQKVQEPLDLSIEVQFGRKNPRVCVSHSSSVSVGKIKILSQHFLQSLQKLTSKTLSKLENIDMLGLGERMYLLEMGKPLTKPAEGLVHRLFEDQVLKTPNNDAIQFEMEKTLTYTQLNCLANGVARQLRCGPGDMVPICMHRSCNLPVALLAVLKTGAAYVTMDPDVPHERNSFIIEDVGAKFILSDKSLLGLFPSQISFDELVLKAPQYDQSNLNIPELVPSDPCYVIYTSGSTGMPKGVILEHRNAYCGLVAFPDIPDLRQLWFHNPVFSAAQRSVWSTLKQGGCLCLASKKNLTVFIGDTINKMRINTIDVTPSTASLITPGTVPCLKRMTVAGELINPALVPLWIDRLELLNAYGLSENTQFNWRNQIIKGQNPQNIGRPSDTTTAYVLEPGTINLCPILVPGELCLGGHQLARGYLNRPEKTAAAFIRNPFGPGRLYRTGDMVVTHDDGSIEMIGRIDFQIKINDQRVEPGEANSILQVHPEVIESSVVAASVGNKKVLVGAIIPRRPNKWKNLIGQMKGSLKARIPQYMIPSYWYPVNSLPLNVNGKVDIPSLSRMIERIPKVDLIKSSSGAIDLTKFEFVQDRGPLTSGGSTLKLEDEASGAVLIPKRSSLTTTPAKNIECSEVLIRSGCTASNYCSSYLTQNTIETPSSDIQTTAKQDLVLAISEILDIPLDVVDLSSSFNSLGGSSMEAILLSSRIRTMGIDVDVAEIMTATSLDFLLGSGDQEIRSRNTVQTIAPFTLVSKNIQAEMSGYEDVYPPTQMQEDLIADTLAEMGNYDYYKAFDLGIYSLLDFKIALDRVIESNPILRSSFISKGLGFMQVVNKSMAVPWEMSDKSVYDYIEDSRQNQWVELGGPLIRAAATSNSTVVLVLHHAVFDHWSTQFLQIDLARILTGMRPEVRPNFNLFINHLQRLNLSEHDDFWKSYLSGYHPMPLQSTKVGNSFYDTIDLDHDLSELARLYKVSLASLVYAIWASSLAHITKCQDITFFVPLSGRDASVKDIVKMFGPTLSIVPLRVWVDYGTGIADLAKEIHEEIWALSKYANYGIRRIMKSAGVEKGSINTLVNIMIRSEEPTLCGGLKSISVPPKATNNLLTVEVDALEPKRIRLMSRVMYSYKSEIIQTLRKEVGELATRSAAITPALVGSVGINQSSETNTHVKQQSSSTYPETQFCDRGRPVTRSKGHTPLNLTTAGEKEQVKGIEKNLPQEHLELEERPNPSILNLTPTPSLNTLTKSLTLRRPYRDLGLSLSASVAYVLSERTGNNKVIFGSVDPEFPSSIVAKTVSRNIAQTLGDLVSAVGSSESLYLNYTEAMKLLDTIVVLNDEIPILSKGFTVISAKSLGTWCQLSLHSSMDRMLGEFVLEEVAEVLDTMIDNPSISLAELSCVGKKERAYLLQLAQAIDPEPQLLYARFEEFSRKYPNKIALEWGKDEVITYGELSKISSSLANYLWSQGVKAGEKVPLMFEKSTAAIICMLGVMKSGAAYVPISGDAPDQRNLFIVSDVNANLILTQRRFHGFGAKTNSRILCFEDIEPQLLNDDKIRSVYVDPESIAYCIYTSGSTGNPKGVMVPHSSASAAVGSMLEAEGRFEGKWRVLQFADFVFDASVQDIFNTLSSGGTLCMIDRDRMLSGLTETINEMDISHIILTPTVAETFAPEEVPTLKKLLLGGEVMSQSIIDKWSARCELLNVYGPTETSMVVCSKHVLPNTSRRNVGRPFKTVAAVILDVDGQRMRPLGAVGELCIAGAQVTAGYMNQKELSRKSYTDSAILGRSIMYRTGDLAKWLPGGEIEILGRTDSQVKIAGNRVELDEVETSIKRTNLVTGCVAQLVKLNDTPSLVAVVVFNQVDASQLDPIVLDPEVGLEQRAALIKGLDSLPTYMIPKYLLPMNQLPRLPSQKVDRKALRAIVNRILPEEFKKYRLMLHTAPFEDLKGQRPVSEQEILLSSIWSDIFQVPHTDIDTNTSFLALGGDSVAAINMASIVRKAGWRISVKDIMHLETLGTVAAKMKAQDSHHGSRAVARYEPPTEVVERMSHMPITPEDIYYWYPVPPGQTEFLNQGAKPDQLWVLMTVKPFPSNLSVHKWLGGVRALASISETLRSTFLKVPGKGWIAAVLKSSEPDFVEIDCDLEEKEIYIDRFWRRRFEFGKPFTRYMLLSYPNGKRDLVIKMDHGLWDGTLLRLWDESFAALIAGRNVPQRESPQEFALEHHRAKNDGLLKFWKNMIPPPKSWPNTDSPVIASFITRELDINLEKTANAAGVTIPIIFQAAFQLWLASKQSRTDNDKLEACFDYLLTGRNVELPNPQLIDGNCANFLPFKVVAPTRSTLVDYLEKTQSLFWEATENGWIGLEDIYGSSKRRDLLGNQVMFLFQPFQPPKTAAPSTEGEYGYVKLGGASVTMRQPYSLVIEVSRAVVGYRIKVMFDNRAFNESKAEDIATEIITIIKAKTTRGIHHPLEAYLPS